MKSKRFPKDSIGTQSFGILAIVAVAVVGLTGGTVFGISVGKKKKG